MQKNNICRTMFKHDKNILLDDSSIQGNIISENSGIDDAIKK